MIGLNSSTVAFDQQSDTQPVQRTYKPCVVCNDKSSGYHYGVSSCEGCKGFFRRSVQKNVQYVCHKDQKCVINKLTRNRCQHCRFVKCFEKGMSKEAVRNDRHKKKQQQTTNNSDTSTIGSLSRLSTKDHELIDTINKAHLQTLSWTPATGEQFSTPTSISSTKSQESDAKSDTNRAPSTLAGATQDHLVADADLDVKLLNSELASGNEFESVNGSDESSVRTTASGLSLENGTESVKVDPSRGIAAISETIKCVTPKSGQLMNITRPLWDVLKEFSTDGIIQIVNFAKRVPGFLNLPNTDQVILLKASCVEIMMLRIVQHYNVSSLIQSSATIEYFEREGLGDFGGSLLSLAMHFSSLALDTKEYALLCAVCLFSNDRLDLQGTEVAQKLQESLLLVLNRYVLQRRSQNGNGNGNTIFAKMLVSLTEVRSISIRYSFRLLHYRNQRGHERGELLQLYTEMFDRGENVHLLGSA